MPAVHPQLGVCTWSLQPQSPSELKDAVTALGVSQIQLHLDPLRSGAWSVQAFSDATEHAGINVASGMMTTQDEDYSTLESIRRTGGVTPDSTWAANMRAAEANARLAEQMGIRLVSLHAGHLPDDPATPQGSIIIERLQQLASIFAGRGVTLALETGQETAPTLMRYLTRLPSVRVNFDPANMLLYNMGDPIEAFAMLAPHIAQVHLKDAMAPTMPGVWGTEVPVGSGEIDWPRFITLALDRCPDVALMIEREAGDDRRADISTAIRYITPLLEMTS